MYKHQITIELLDDVVHRYSIMEWESILLANDSIQHEELPLSYGRIAEILAVELYRYNDAPAVERHQWKCTEDTTYTDDGGNTVNTKVPLAEPNTMQIGIARYGRRAPA